MMPPTLPPPSAIHIGETKILIGDNDAIAEHLGFGNGFTRLGLIVGCSRSGTTWLYRMLTHLKGVKGLGEAGLGAELRKLGNASAGLVVWSNSVLALDKTPANVYDLKYLSRVHDARVVHLVRDPRAVVASMLDAAHSWAAARAGFHAGTAAELWVRAVDEAHSARRWWGNRMVQVRYEDLRADTRSQLQVACHALGLSPSMRAVVRCVERERFEQLASRYETGVGHFFRNGLVDSWRQDLSRPQVELVEAIAGERLARLGYKCWRR